MTGHISISWDALVDQASSTSEQYVFRANRYLKDAFPNLKESERAALAVQLAQVAAVDFAATAQVVASQNIQSALTEVADALRSTEK